MKRCPDCKAPNPQTQTVCYSCGQSLSKRPHDAVAPGARTFPCVNCAGDIPFGAGECPHCGRAVTAPSGAGATIWEPPTVTRVLPPNGWAIETLPDGTVRLTRPVSRRALREAGALSGVVAVIAYLVFYELISEQRGTSGPHFPVAALVVIGGVLLTGAAVWAFGGRETIRTGPRFLEFQRSFGPWKQAQRIETSGALRIGTRRSNASVEGGVTVRRVLWAEGGGGVRITIDAASASSGRDILASTLRYDPWRPTGLTSAPHSLPVSAPFLVDDDPHFLGRYLSDITGWPLDDPEAPAL